MGIEDDRLRVRLQILTTAARVDPLDLPDVTVDVHSVQVELLAQRRFTARDGVPQGRRNRSDLSRPVDRLIHGGDQRRQLGPLPVADGREHLARQRDVGSDKACDLTQLHLEGDHGQRRPDGGRVPGGAHRVHGDEAGLGDDAATGREDRSEVRTVLDGERSAGLQQGLCRVGDPVEPLHTGEGGSEVAGQGRRITDRGKDGGELLPVGGRNEPEVDQIELEFRRDLAEDNSDPREHLGQDRRCRRRVGVHVGFGVLRTR